MWWRLAVDLLAPKQAERPLYEERILRSCAERLVRRRIMGATATEPEEPQVKRLVERVMKAIRDEFGDYSLVRLKTDGDNLEPVVSRFVDALRV